MPKEVGNQKQQKFVAVDYFWFIKQTITLTFVFVSDLVEKDFRSGCFARRHLLRPRAPSATSPHSMDSPDCLPILLSISVFTLVFLLCSLPILHCYCSML